MIRVYTGWQGFKKEEQAFSEVVAAQDPERPVFALLDGFTAPEVPYRGSGIEALDDRFEDGWAFWFATDIIFPPNGVSPGNQDDGNCVSYSDVLSAIDGMCDEVMFGDEIEAPFIPLVHFSYGAGRVYVGKNRLGRGAGSLGSWQIAADHEYGYLDHRTPGIPGPIKPSERCEPVNSEYQRWPYTKSLLDRWVPVAAKRKLGTSSRIQTTDELVKAIVELKMPCTIASNQGFRSAGFDSHYGVHLWKFGGSWAHQMHIRAVVKIKASWFVYIGNQWGRGYHGDPGIGPRGGFWVPLELMDQWIPRAVVFARGKFKGNEPEKPNFGVI